MIIQQDIKLRNRSTLKLMKHVAREQRDERRERVSRGTELFAEKWSAQRLSRHFTETYIPKVISETVEHMIAPSASQNDQDEGKAPSSIKSMLMETVERILPLLIKRIWA